MNKVAILIYTKAKTLEHKRDLLVGDTDKSPTGEYYWRLGVLPKKIKEVKRIYFAADGKVQGSFAISGVVCSGMSQGEIAFKADTWVPVKNEIRVTSYRGFKYIDPEFFK